MAIDPLAGRVTVVLAAAGYGKTTAVRAWLGDRPARWLDAAAPTDCTRTTVIDDLRLDAALPTVGTRTTAVDDLRLDAALPTGGTRTTAVDDLRLDAALPTGGALTTVVDDLQRAAAPPAAGPLPPGARIVLITRRPLAAGVLQWALRLAPGPLIEVGPDRLALTPAGVGRLLRDRYGVEDPAAADRVARLTDGWPALAELIGAAGAGAARSDEELLAMLAAPGTPLAGYVRREVLGGLAPPARRLLSDAAALGSICAGLAAELGHRRPEAAIGELVRLGLAKPVTAGEDLPTGRYRPVAAIAAVLRAGAPAQAARRHRRVLGAAADWHRRERRPAEALRLRLAAGDHAGGAELLAAEGADLLAGGAARDVADAVRRLPPAHRDRRTDLLLAQALEMTGDSAGAVAVYAALAGPAGPLEPGLAWRYGVALYLWVDPGAALAVFRRGALSGEDTADEALLLGWTAAAHWLAGDHPACRDHAGRALRAAEAAADRRAMATAYVALALCANLDGQPAVLQANYARALEHADAAGDVVQAIRIRANLAVALEREARYADALDLLRPAVALAERAGHISLLAVARCNEAVQLHRLGRLDEAAAGYTRSIELYQRIDSRKVAYPLNNLGDLHRQRGRHNEARAAYEEARLTATADRNRQGLVPALAGLARTVALDDPVLAAALAGQAVQHAVGSLEVAAQLAAGHAALAGDGAERAAGHAARAADAARRHRDRAGLAEALELQAAASADPRAIRQALGEALAIWCGARAGLDADRVRLAVGRLGSARPEERLDARLAAQRLAAAGVILADPPPAGPRAGPGAGPSVQIRALGRFAVVVDGVPAPPWQSRKARDLLRILVARRGRPVPRDELGELLWGAAPGGDDKAAHRFAVALSTARGVLDPRRCCPADRFIAAGPSNLWLDVERVTVDVEQFLADARYALRLAARAAPHQDAHGAYAMLGAVAQGYAGEVFADDPYDDWARGLRAEVETVRIDLARALARLAGDPGEAARHLASILEAEPYDEQSHRALLRVLTAAGRHGEARRAYERYVLAMDEIGVPAAAFEPTLRSG